MMFGLKRFKRITASANLFFVYTGLLVTLITGCGDDASTPTNISPASNNTGSATFSIQWHSAADERNPDTILLERQAITDCQSAGVHSITCEVYDASGNPIASGGPWPCDARSGRLDRIPAGPNRIFVILGWDADQEKILYQGQTSTGVTIIPGEIADAGSIVAHAIIPGGLVATTRTTSGINLAWSDFDEPLPIGGYRIFRDGVAIGISQSRTYADENLNSGIQYCYTVAAYDTFGNESGQSIESCAITEPSVDEVDDDGDGYSEIQGDCDDTNDGIHPGATEICNGVDDNCSGEIDEGLSTDADGDGHYTPTSCATPADDCNDASGSVYAGATEICGDGIDQDCSGEDLSCDAEDNDGDGYSEVQGDCDDTNAEINPAAIEICNGINDNCTGGIDEGLSTDADGDRHYTPGSCLTPADDCDDTRSSVYPGATETCNGIDDNCTGGIDEGLSRPTTCGVGACADNTGTATCSAGIWTDNTCNPMEGATTESCDNVDNDCDGTVDEALSRSTTCGAGACADNIGTATCTDGNWNDTCDPLAGATAEACDNIDNDCDGAVDEGLSRPTTCGVGACADNTGTATCTDGDWNDTCDPLAGAAAETCDNVDNDCDGTVDEGLNRPTTCGVGACADNTGTITCRDGNLNNTCDPLAGATAETCDNVDNDCDGTVDEGLARQTTCGVGACADNTGTATCRAGNWNDTCDPLAGAAAETCDNVDNDCDGTVDEGLNRTTTCGVGACSDNTGTATCTAGNWNDTCDPLAGATTERCDEVDNDCDGAVDEGVQNTYYYDGDGDRYGDIDSPTQACSPPSRYVDNGLDCRDDLPEVNPGVMEVCHDGLDNNCNDQTDEDCAIDVNIDRDFEYIDQGWPMGLTVYQTAAGPLSRTPVERLTEPSYYDSYGEFYSISYGYLEMGNSQDNIISFAIVRFQDTSGDHYHLYIDSNNNEDLRDDNGPHANQGTGRLAALVSLQVTVINDSGARIIRPYQLWIWLSDFGAVRFYTRCHYRGNIQIGGGVYTAVAYEIRDHDALYRESGLYIDLDGNGQLDEDTENFMDQSTVTVNGRQYELLLNYP